MKKNTLPVETIKLINHYINLKVGNKNIRSPYYQNYKSRKANKVFVGKGLPKDIEQATKNTFKKCGKNPDKISAHSIRYFMIMNDLGIDCSGFVKNVLESYLKETRNKKLKSVIKPKQGILNYIRHLVRFETNLSADMLTNKLNTKIVKLSDVNPGDLIRFGKGHVAIITQVTRNSNSIKEIIFAHSTTDYFETSGVRKEKIIIKNEMKPLEMQIWQKMPDGISYSLNDYLMAKKSDRGIRRIKNL